MSDPTLFYREAYERSEDSLPGGGLDWLRAIRRSALDDFGVRGFPAPREEDWKYTRVAPIAKQEFALADGSADIDADQALSALRLPEDTGAHELIFVDGHLRADLCRAGDAPEGVSLVGLADSLSAGGSPGADVSQQFLGRDFPAATGFSALNTAFSADGLVLRLAPGAVLDAPVHLVFITSGTADVMVHPRIILDLGQGARATVIEHYASAADSASFTNAVTQVQLADQAKLVHYKLQREALTAFHVARMDAHLGAGAQLVSHSANLGASLARHDINVSLEAPGGHCTLNGLYAVHARQHVDYHTRIDHIAPECTSDEDYRGILGGRSRGVFNGRVYVHPDAQKSDASQSNRNLLLSRNAEVDTKPQLEIHANDVKCAHGATVGQLDAKMIFYLRSRGIEEATARALLTYGFARDLLDRMDLEHLREIVSESLLDRLPHAGELRSMLS